MTKDIDLADTQGTWTVKTIAEVGLLLRGSFVSSLKEFCFRNDIKLMIEESKGWLESSYFIKAETRDYSKVLKLKRFIEYMEL